jgi:hypothetical protein
LAEAFCLDRYTRRPMAALPGASGQGLRAVLGGAAWIGCAVVVALGGAGIVVGADHVPGDATRPELTARADARMRAAITPIALELQNLQAEVTRLGQAGRTALVDLTRRDASALQLTLDAGDQLVTSMEVRKAVIRQAVRDLPYPAGSGRLGDAVRNSLIAIDDALAAVDDIPSDWDQLARGAVPAIRLAGFLEQHDRQTFVATERARQDDYSGAIRELQTSLQIIDQAKAIRDRLVSTTDVVVLSMWLDRNERFDRALLVLYGELDRSPTRITPKARAAFAEVDRLQKLLPVDTRALVVVMSDIAQGGLNQAVIAIELARGRLADAEAAVD